MTTIAEDKLTVRCEDCRVERATKPTKTGETRIPTGWKRREEALYCGDCWRRMYILRAITIPVASPLDEDWESLWKQLHLLWAQTTAAANRIMTECYTRDVRRKPDDVKIPPMPPVYLYPELRKEFPNLPSQTVASLEQACKAKYRAARFDLWRAEAALPTYRYPTPLPIPAQAWHGRIEQDRPVVSMRLTERIELRLKSGTQFRRQLAQFRQIARGEAIPGEAAIYKRGKVLLVKMAAWLPRPAQVKGSDGTLIVRTQKDNLLLAVNGKDETLWKYHGDHLRRWAAEHRKRLQRWADDSKFEQRPVPSFAQRREAAAIKFRDRMNSATHEISAQLAGYASRRKFARVEYDDTVREFCPDLPWFRLKALIEQKLDVLGIEFASSLREFASASPVEKKPGALAEEEDAK